MTFGLSKSLAVKEHISTPDQGTDDSESHLHFKRTYFYPDQGMDDCANPDWDTGH
jgi:hypothetical protein